MEMLQVFKKMLESYWVYVLKMNLRLVGFLPFFTLEHAKSNIKELLVYTDS